MPPTCEGAKLGALEAPARRARVVLDRASRKPSDGDPPPPPTRADVERTSIRVHALLRYLRAKRRGGPGERASLDAKRARVLDKPRSTKAALESTRRSGGPVAKHEAGSAGQDEVAL